MRGGAIIGKNPGSAKANRFGVWAPLQLDRDTMLPTVRNTFRAAYSKARKQIPSGAYVQVWNLFYLCDPNLAAAIKTIGTVPSPSLCRSEKTKPSIVWFAWGGSDSVLDPMKVRFESSSFASPFFYDHKKVIQSRVPTPDDFPKHTQGLPMSHVIEFLGPKL